MTDLLVKKFIKDYKNVENAKVRTDYGVLASMVGICCNVFLFCVKILAGLLAGSISVMADAFNNLSDAASSIVGFVGMKMAGKPADSDHPFGHGRIEYIAAFIVAFLVIEVGFSLFKTSVKKIFHPEEMVFHVAAVAILLLSIGVKLWLSIFNRRLGKRIESTVMMATSADSMGDVAATSATIFSILFFGIFGVNIDGFVGLIVSGVVLLAGFRIARDTLEPLIGQAIDPKIYKEITDFVESYDGIMGTHDLLVHNYGPSRSMASIHAEVPSSTNIELSHELIDRIEKDCMRQLGILLVIHMDPVKTHDEKTDHYKELVKEILSGMDSRLTFHDFRIVDGVERINLIFDLVVPGEYNEAMRDTLRKKISEEVQKTDNRCFCVITIENSFCAKEEKSV